MSEDLEFSDLRRFRILFVEDEKRYIDRLKEPVEEVLREHGIPSDRIDWFWRTNLAEALDLIEQVEKENSPEHGFDVAFCDLRIPARPEEMLNPEFRHGLTLVRRVAVSPWRCPIVGITQFEERDDLLTAKMEEADRLSTSVEAPSLFDDFLFKEAVITNRPLALAKLRRSLIPIRLYVELARHWRPPVFFLGARMRGILRDLILISREPRIERRLPRILLLGEPGSGKSALARAYDQILRLRDRDPNLRPPMIEVNCASLVAAGEGGRLQLFGYSSNAFGGRPSPGVFEEASYYNSRTRQGLGEGEPDPDRAGVVFFDEFAELDPQLQAAILKTIEENVVQRQDNQRVNVACHVVLATNADLPRLIGPEQKPDASEKRIRPDLIDRIPYALRVPSLLERRQEIPLLIEATAAARLQELTSGTLSGAKLSFSAQRLVDRAVDLRLIRSMRQIQSIASVLPGESTITDINLLWVLKRARILGLERTLLDPTASTAVKVDALKLPKALAIEPLPEVTATVIDLLYGRLKGEVPYRDVEEVFPKTSKSSQEQRWRYYLLAKLVHPEDRVLLYGEVTPEALRQRWHTAALQCRLKLVGRPGQDEPVIVKYLLTEPQ